MPIKVKCACGKQLSASDKMAGKRVKCPNCAQPISIPALEQNDDFDDELTLEPAAPVANGGQNSLMDLLDDADVKHATTGPICPDCGSDMKPDAIICLECGFNVASGERLDTYAGGVNPTAGMTEHEKILAKAEQEIEGKAMTADEESFGDGPESILIAVGALVIATILVGTAVAVIYLIDQNEESANSGMVAFGFGIVIWLLGRLWLTISGFINGVQHGAGCLLCDFYALFFGISRKMWIPVGLHVLGTITILLGYFTMGGDPA